MNKYEREPMHLHFPSGRILELGDIPLGKYDFDNDRYKKDSANL